MSSREQGLAHALVGLADNLVKDFDIVDLFYELVEATTDLLAVDQAGLLLAAPDGDVRVMAVTNESADVVDLLQAATEAGPCYEAFRSGQVIQESFNGQATRWPEFASRARRHDFGYLAAIPMRLRDETIGTLNLLRNGTEALGDDDLMAGRALADIATIAIIQERAAKQKDTLVGQLERALDSRMAIEQAKGFVAEAVGLSPDTAFERLRTYARSNNLRLREVAHQVTSGGLDARAL